MALSPPLSQPQGDAMILEGVEPLLENTYELCRQVSAGDDAMAKAERAVAFHRKLVDQEIVCLTPQLEDKLGSCEEMLISARAASGTRSALTEAQEGHATSSAEARLPLDVLGVVLDHVDCRKDPSLQNRTLRSSVRVWQSTLCSLALCNKTLYTLAQPRLFSQAELYTSEQLLQFAYALELNQNNSRFPLLVKSLSVAWDAEPEDEAQLSNHRLIHMVLSACPLVTALTLQRKDSGFLQGDVDALDEILRCTTQLESLEFRLTGDYDENALSVWIGTDPDFILQRSTTDRLRRLRSFAMRTDSSDLWHSDFLIYHLGPDLRRIELELEFLRQGQLLAIAECSPQLEEVVLLVVYVDAYAELSRFIETVGPSLTLLDVDLCHHSTENDESPPLDTATPSVLFDSLMLHAKAIKVLKLSNSPGFGEEDLKILAHPECLPRLKELSISDTENMMTEGGQTSEAQRCEGVIAAIIESHQTTLEQISISSSSLLLGDIFIQACLRLRLDCRIDIPGFAPETSPALLDRLN